MTETYAWVDRGPDPQGAADWQDRVNAWPVVEAYKRHIQRLVSGAANVLDVGCGTGHDLRHHRNAFGVDRSFVMLSRAAASGACLAAADAANLPFRDDAFAAVRADRVLQHVDDPESTLDELLRVLEPGGAVVIADPDQGTLVIEVPWASSELVERVRRRRRDVQYRNGALIRRVPYLLGQRGVGEVAVAAFVLALTDPDDAFGLPTWVADAHEKGSASAAEVREWDLAMQRARHEPGFAYIVTYLVVSGRKPVPD